MTPDLIFDRLTDDRGVYRIFGLRPGTYVVSAGGSGSSAYGINGYDHDVPIYAPSSTRDTAAQIAVRSGEETTGDIHYRRETGRVVSGYATSPAGPDSPWIAINLARLIDGSADVARITTYQLVGAKGFEFSGVAEGEYLIWAHYAPGNSDRFVSERRRITVKGADVTGIELTAKALATVTGEFVLVPSTAEGCRGKRQPSFDETVVAVERSQKGSARAELEWPLSRAAQSSPTKSGNFVLRNLAPGQYSFEVRFFARYWYLQSITQRPTAISKETTNQTIDLARSWLTLSRESVSGVKVTLTEGAATVAGQVEKPDNQPLPARLFVYLVPTEREKTDDPSRYAAAQIKADGSFSVDHVSLGRYWLITKVAPEDDLAGTRWLRFDASERRAKLRREAESTNMVVDLKPCQNISEYKLPLK